jgi:hypothetical protein
MYAVKGGPIAGRLLDSSVAYALGEQGDQFLKAYQQIHGKQYKIPKVSRSVCPRAAPLLVPRPHRGNNRHKAHGPWRSVGWAW